VGDQNEAHVVHREQVLDTLKYVKRKRRPAAVQLIDDEDERSSAFRFGWPPELPG
jgi:hypothetical protein